MVRVVAWEGGSRGIENFIGQILLPGEGSLKRNDFDQVKSKLTWPKFPNGMRWKKMEQGLWLQLKILFLLGYNLKIAIHWERIYFGGVGGGEVRYSRCGS